MRFNYRKKYMELQRSAYENGKLQLIVKEVGKPGIKFTITTQTKGYDAPTGYIPIKVWEENKDIVEVLYNSGIFTDTGHRADVNIDGKIFTIEYWEFINPSTLQHIPIAVEPL